MGELRRLCHGSGVGEWVKPMKHCRCFPTFQAAIISQTLKIAICKWSGWSHHSSKSWSKAYTAGHGQALHLWSFTSPVQSIASIDSRLRRCFPWWAINLEPKYSRIIKSQAGLNGRKLRLRCVGAQPESASFIHKTDDGVTQPHQISPHQASTNFSIGSLVQIQYFNLSHIACLSFA